MDRQFTTGFKDAQPLWLSSYQLLVHFQLFSGSIGPVCAHKQWFAGEDRLDQTPLLNTIFLQQATWWSHYLRRIGTAFGLEVKPTPGRPAGTSLAIWTRCFYIRFSPTAVAGWTDGFCHIQDGQWGRLDRKWKISPPHYGEGDHDLRWQPSLFHQRRTSEPNEKRRNGMIEGFWTLLKWGCPKIQRWWFFIRKTMEHQLWGANLEKTGTRWSSWNVGLRTTPQLRIFTLDPSAKSFHKFSSFNQQNEVIMNSYLARIQGLNILCTSKNVGLLNLQLLRSFFHTFCYQKNDHVCHHLGLGQVSVRSPSLEGSDDTRHALLCGVVAAEFRATAVSCIDRCITNRHLVIQGDAQNAAKNTGTLGKIRENHEKQTEMADVWWFLRILWFSKCMFWLIPLVLILMGYWLDWVIGSETLIGIDGVEGININQWHPNQRKICALGHVLVFAESMFLSTSPLLFFQ